MTCKLNTILAKAFLYGAIVAFVVPAFAQAESTSTNDQKVYTLPELLTAVIHRNPAMHGKRAEVESKEFQADGAKAARYPNGSIQAGYVNTSSNNTDSTDPTLNLQIRQPLWAFGRISNSIDYANEDVEANKADLVRISRQLLDQTVVAYAKLESIKQQQSILKDSIGALERLSQQIQRRYEGRVASKADVDLAGLRLIQARTQKNNVDGNLLLATTELAALTQLPVNQVAPLTPDIISLPTKDEELIALAVTHSAEIGYRSSLFKLAQANTAKERSAIMPTIYAYASKQIDDLSSSDGEQVGIIVEASFDGAGFAQVAASKAALSQETSSKEGIAVARTELLREVNSLIHSRNTQGDMANVIDQSIGSFESILASYIRQYEAGKKTWLDVLNIQREMTSTQLELVNVRTQWYQASLQLMVLVGQLDETVQRTH